MKQYLVKGADPEDFETIYATHPALPGTYVGYAEKDGGHFLEPVILWAVLSNGTPEPITMDGVWGGTEQPNSFVLFPDGRCARFEQSWPNLTEAIVELGQLERR